MMHVSSLILVLFLIFLHPLMLVLLLTMQTLPVIILIINMQENTWMGYMLFLIFLGGLLVIFIYLSALVPNEIFIMSPPMVAASMTAMTLSSAYVVSETKNSSSIMIPQFSQTHTQTILPMMILYLLMGLCMVMFVCSFMKSPVKQQMN